MSKQRRLPQLLEFKIELKGTRDPKVWRRLLVPDKFSFHHFHRVIQAAFGWYDQHLYEFFQKGMRDALVITHPKYLPETTFKNSLRYKLRDYFEEKGEKIVYVYDFGDDWEHIITLDQIFPMNENRAACIGGGGATPPEDCGGIPGYEDFRKVMKDAAHPDHAGLSEWAGLREGQPWDAAAFDLDRTNRIVKGM